MGNSKINMKIVDFLSELELNKFKVVSIESNDYFGDDINFYILRFNDLPNWKFGLLIDSNYNYNLFGENDLLIDKFKPSSVSFNVYLNFLNNNDFEILVNVLNDLFTYSSYYFVDSFNSSIDSYIYKGNIDLNIEKTNLNYYNNLYNEILDCYVSINNEIEEEASNFIKTVLNCKNVFNVNSIGIRDRHLNKPDNVSYSHRFIVYVNSDNNSNFDILSDIKNYLSINFQSNNGLKYNLVLCDSFDNKIIDYI